MRCLPVTLVVLALLLTACFLCCCGSCCTVYSVRHQVEVPIDLEEEDDIDDVAAAAVVERAVLPQERATGRHTGAARFHDVEDQPDDVDGTACGETEAELEAAPPVAPTASSKSSHTENPAAPALPRLASASGGGAFTKPGEDNAHVVSDADQRGDSPNDGAASDSSAFSDDQNPSTRDITIDKHMQEAAVRALANLHSGGLAKAGSFDADDDGSSVDEAPTAAAPVRST